MGESDRLNSVILTSVILNSVILTSVILTSVIPSEVRRQPNGVEGPCVYAATTSSSILSGPSLPKLPVQQAIRPALV